MMGLLYLLAAADHSQVKIGITRDDASLRGRLAALGGLARFDLAKSRLFRCVDNYAVEQFLHLLVGDCKIDTEAFVNGAGKTECFSFDAYTRALEFLANHSQLVSEIEAPFQWRAKTSSQLSAKAIVRAKRREQTRLRGEALLASFDAVWVAIEADRASRCRFVAGGGSWLAYRVPVDQAPLTDNMLETHSVLDHQGNRWHLTCIDMLSAFSDSGAAGIQARLAIAMSLPLVDVRSQPFIDAFYQCRWGDLAKANAAVCEEVAGELEYLSSIAQVAIHCSAGKAFLLFELAEPLRDNAGLWEWMRLHLMGILRLPRLSDDRRCRAENIVCFPSSWFADGRGYIELGFVAYALANPMQMLWDAAVADLLYRFVMLPAADDGALEGCLASERLTRREAARDWAASSGGVWEF